MQDVITRWNSTLIMINQLLKLLDDENEASLPDSTQWGLLAEMSVLLT
jgi:hypothetical protein